MELVSQYSQEEKEYFMRQALLEAEKAQLLNEVPIGAVVVLDGEIIGRGYNVREFSQDATTHAEMIAIRNANRKTDSWRLEEASLFVTLEPCPMCAGAIINSRVKDVYYGARDIKAGACESLYHLLEDNRLNHRCFVESGILEKECAMLLIGFFKIIREEKKRMKKKASFSE